MQNRLFDSILRTSGADTDDIHSGEAEGNFWAENELFEAVLREAKYNPNVSLVADNPDVTNNSAKNYYIIDSQGQIIWTGQEGETLLDLENAIRQLYNLGSKNNTLVKFNATMNRYANPQPKTVQFVNESFQGDEPLENVLAILQNNKIWEKIKRKL